MSEDNKKEKTIPVSFTFDVVRRVTNDGAGRRLAVALKIVVNQIRYISKV